MDHNYIRDFHLVDRYVLGKLSDAELARFEEHFIDCADCIVELKIAQTFIENLRSSSLPNSHQTPATDRNTVETNSSRAEKRAARGYFKFTRGLLAPAAAIAIILIIGGVSISFYEIHNLRREVLEAKNNSGQWQNKYENERQLFEASNKTHEETERDLNAEITELKSNSKPTEPPASKGSNGYTEPQANLSVFILNAVRSGDSSSNELKLPASAKSFVMSIPIQNKKFDKYKVTILDIKKKEIWAKDGLKTERNALYISFDSNFFQPKVYFLKLEGVNNDKSFTFIDDYSFHVKKER